MAYQAHVSDKKKSTVKRFAELLKDYPIVGAVNMENLPAKQLQGMRSQLRGKVVILMTKRRLLNIAIDKIKSEKPGIEKLKEHLIGMPALLFTKENPFSLAKTLKKNRSNAPAKAGQTAPNDIKVSAGATPFAPGPIIGELSACGIKAGVDAGKVAIKEDAVVVKAGQVIKPNVAAILTRLGIEPMEIGLNLTAVYENGTIYAKNVLDIDEDKFMADFSQAAAWAFNLAVETATLTKDTTDVILMKAYSDAKALALSQDIIADATAGEILAKAERQAMALKARVPE